MLLILTWGAYLAGALGTLPYEPGSSATTRIPTTDCGILTDFLSIRLVRGQDLERGWLELNHALQKLLY